MYILIGDGNGWEWMAKDDERNETSSKDLWVKGDPNKPP
jgi:hypothetical protein